MGKDGQDQNSNGVWHTGPQDEYGAQRQEEERHRTSLIPDDFENAPTNWLVPAVLSAIFFLPTGIVAISNARKAQRASQNGEHELWRHYTGRTRFFVFLSLVLGILTCSILSVVIHLANNT